MSRKKKVGYSRHYDCSKKWLVMKSISMKKPKKSSTVSTVVASALDYLHEKLQNEVLKMDNMDQIIDK